MPKKLDLDDKMADLLRQRLKLDKFYDTMSTDELERLFPSSGLYQYDKDDIVIHQGESSRDLFIIETGEVSVIQDSNGRLKRLSTLGPGSVLGEIAILRGGIRVANAVAAKESKIYRLSFPDVELVMTNNAPLGKHLMSLAKKRLAE